jgi:hypothetical protein
MPNENNGSILSGIIWMFVISILLFWLPFAGPFIAGIVGGKKAGGVDSALIAVFLPCIIFGVALFILASSLTGIPLIGVIAGAGGFVLAISNIGPLLLGAIIGGIIA